MSVPFRCKPSWSGQVFEDLTRVEHQFLQLNYHLKVFVSILNSKHIRKLLIGSRTTISTGS